jgi:HAD superfamily 5'-nucleotidase-like hydrolase
MGGAGEVGVLSAVDPPVPTVRAPIAPLRQVYVNRNLDLARIELVGFDMDYTLALYNQPRIEDLSIRETLRLLCETRGYPREVDQIRCDPRLGIRGLVVDQRLGNVLKTDRYGTPGRVLHGHTRLSAVRASELYQRERTLASDPRYARIDSLYALPEVVLYLALVEHFANRAGPGPERLWQDIRDCVDLAHRDGSIKSRVCAELSAFVDRDSALAETLHRFRSTGKRLFLLTNSDAAYADAVMGYLLDGVLSAYSSWRSYFDVIVVSARKPQFFTAQEPFGELDDRGQPAARPSRGPFVRGRLYAGGNLRDFEARAGSPGNRVLFVGDHIYGDMLRPRKSSTWRTAMILQELEHEVEVHEELAPALRRLDELERQLRVLDAEIADRRALLRSLRRGLDGPGLEVAAARRALRQALDDLSEQLQQRMAEHAQLERTLDAAFNPTWGPLFREGHEISQFGDQVEAYACLYTSRTSNFRFYSPNHHFRGPRDRMPHER